MTVKAVYLTPLLLLLALAPALNSCEAPPNYDNVQKVFPAVVRVATEGRTGTGFIATSKGYVVTCQHVVGDSKAALVQLNSGVQYQCSVAAADEARDLAVIKLPESAAGYPFAITGNSDESDSLQTGDPVTVLSYPAGNEIHNLTLTTGVLCGFGRSRSVDYLQTSAKIYPGSSGGPVTDSAGQVIGVINSQYATVTEGCTTFATASNEAKALLDLAAQGKPTAGGPLYTPPTARPTCSSVGCHAPDFNLATINGKQVSLASLRDKKTILAFVPGGCSSCGDMLPCIQQLYDTWPRTQLEAVVIISGGGTSEAENIVKQYGLKCPVALDKDGSVTGLYKPASLPALYILNSQGDIKVKKYSPVEGCARELDALLRMIYP